MFRKAPQFTVEFAVRVSPPPFFFKKKKHFPKAWLAKLCGGGGNSIFFHFFIFFVAFVAFVAFWPFAFAALHGVILSISKRLLLPRPDANPLGKELLRSMYIHNTYNLLARLHSDATLRNTDASGFPLVEQEQPCFLQPVEHHNLAGRMHCCFRHPVQPNLNTLMAGTRKAPSKQGGKLQTPLHL